ncbi:hypothetical protein BO71DRAFT_486146 [Aspergillus ellipticus CBS 707.79]|uniref:Rhodopsin domain-containing protein n=1 Tax=Aspergillus ellipticus CBS 707.79 TaxID=1448320 RepID=A0A319D2U3_9EURO|nr:hypothetical protein BO71DRAFT_486146 [Aspergillus ellipticus CBS 707.79]
MSSPEGANPSLVTTSLLVVSIVFPILGTVAVSLRIFSSAYRAKRLFLDDYAIILAQLCAWGISIDIFVAAALGGVNNSTGSVLGATIVFLRTLWIEGFPLVGSLVLVKVSILLFYARIFITPWFRIATRVYIAVLIAWGIAIIVAQLLCANPISAAWDPFAIDPLRFDYNAFSEAFAGMSMVFDLLVLCFPIPVIHKLQMSTRQKVQVLAIFWLGMFCCIASAIRFYYIYIDISKSTADTGTNRYSVVTTAFTWGTIEPNASIIAACLPTYGHFFSAGRGLRTFVHSFFSHWTLRSSGSSSRKQASSAKSTTLNSSSQGSYAPTRLSGKWQQRLGLSQSDTVDIEMGDSPYEEHLPLAKDQMRIHVTQSFSQQEVEVAAQDQDRVEVGSPRRSDVFRA